ncbi:MBL fold metallo-hydrolase [Dickeya chrysanthemi]|uniref:MBL fold metallo-hydrolase n=1 Tax=Dickeya chrysanthemi TaxID=556 RepID=UPI000489C40F|nr:MBL fold metallo-hydrolase [Dickeya chrysanthemi]
MKNIYPDLWQSSPEHPFLGVTSHAYLLVKESGNVLFYNSGKLTFEQIHTFGGISFQYLSHRDEAGNNLNTIRKEFNSKLCCHQFEESSINRYASVDILFNKREMIQDNIEVIPTPGHTDGSVCFYVKSPSGKNYLFTGDTIYMKNGVWESRINSSDGGSRTALINSLELLRELAPSVVISSASVGSEAFKEMMPHEWHNAVDGVIRQQR